MLGKPGLSVPFDPNTGLLDEEPTFGIFQPGGEMVWDFGKPHRTNISAVVILEELQVGQRRFLATTPRSGSKVSREEAWLGTLAETRRARGSKRDVSLRELRVVV